MSHVPPIDRFNNGRHREAPPSRGSMTQFLRHLEPIRFKPSRMEPYLHPVLQQYVPGPSIAPTIPQGKGKRPEKMLRKKARECKWLRRENAEIGRMLNEAREDGLIQ